MVKHERTMKWYTLKNLCSKQLENSRENPIEESWTSRCITSRTTKDVQANQKELLVARNIKWHQGIYSEISEMPTE